MADPLPTLTHAVLVDEGTRFTLLQLSHSCHVETTQVIDLVSEGVLEPQGSGPHDWQFNGPALRRARAALRLARDLELNAAGTALVLDLLDEIEGLRSRLRRAGLE